MLKFTVSIIHRKGIILSATLLVMGWYLIVVKISKLLSRYYAYICVALCNCLFTFYILYTMRVKLRSGSCCATVFI